MRLSNRQFRNSDRLHTQFLFGNHKILRDELEDLEAVARIILK
jgi:hypothetical protein